MSLVKVEGFPENWAIKTNNLKYIERLRIKSFSEASELGLEAFSGLSWENVFQWNSAPFPTCCGLYLWQGFYGNPALDWSDSDMEKLVEFYLQKMRYPVMATVSYIRFNGTYSQSFYKALKKFGTVLSETTNPHPVHDNTSVIQLIRLVPPYFSGVVIK